MMTIPSSSKSVDYLNLICKRISSRISQREIEGFSIRFVFIGKKLNILRERSKLLMWIQVDSLFEVYFSTNYYIVCASVLPNRPTEKRLEVKKNLRIKEEKCEENRRKENKECSISIEEHRPFLQLEYLVPVKKTKIQAQRVERDRECDGLYKDNKHSIELK